MVIQTAALPQGLLALDGQSKIWLYSPNAPLSPEQAEAIGRILFNFSAQWTSHNRDLRGWGGVLFGHFLCLAVDESQASASGCAIDRSVALLRQIEEQYGVELFDRFTFVFWDETQGQTQVYKQEQAQAALQAGTIQAQSLVFDPLVNTLDKLRQEFLRPVQSSWHWRFLN